MGCSWFGGQRESAGIYISGKAAKTAKENPPGIYIGSQNSTKLSQSGSRRRRSNQLEVAVVVERVTKLEVAVGVKGVTKPKWQSASKE
ncbi:hypothetical protein SAMN05518847_106150 [Paenibacillus sp. OV219]|nr:hypothetical protein SAMN05518847_106150 [Paenibacillus sp. OV219]